VGLKSSIDPNPTKRKLEEKIVKIYKSINCHKSYLQVVSFLTFTEKYQILFYARWVDGGQQTMMIKYIKSTNKSYSQQLKAY
jgi:hypothetical protein